MKPWTRLDTQDWIYQVEHRLEDIDYYLCKTVQWCEENQVWNDGQVFKASLMTILWVSNMRDETITRKEVFEILGIKEWDSVEDCIYALPSYIQNLDYSELLQLLSNTLSE